MEALNNVTSERGPPADEKMRQLKPRDSHSYRITSKSTHTIYEYSESSSNNEYPRVLFEEIYTIYVNHHTHCNVYCVISS